MKQIRIIITLLTLTFGLSSCVLNADEDVVPEVEIPKSNCVGNDCGDNGEGNTPPPCYPNC